MIATTRIIVILSASLVVGCRDSVPNNAGRPSGGPEPSVGRGKSDADGPSSNQPIPTVIAGRVAIRGGPPLKAGEAVVYVPSFHEDSRNAAKPGRVVFQIRNSLIIPAYACATTGQKIIVTSDDSGTHSIVMASKGKPDQAQPFSLPNDVVEKTFHSPENAVIILCEIHPTEKSYLTILETSQFCIIDDDAHFELPYPLKPGESRIRAYHPMLGRSEKTVRIGGTEKRVSVDLDFDGKK